MLQIMTMKGGRLLLSGLLLSIAFCVSGAGNLPPKIMVLGDSLSAGYGIRVADGWVNLLQQRLRDEGYEHDVVNASVTGNTTGDGLARLPQLLKSHQPSVVVVVLGGNDGLRGYPVKIMQRNLHQMIRQSRDSGARVMIASIQIPPNYGRRYTDQFRESFAKVAAVEKVPLLPFLLDNVATEADLMQDDGIHPATEAQPVILENVWPHVEALL